MLARDLQRFGQNSLVDLAASQDPRRDLEEVIDEFAKGRERFLHLGHLVETSFALSHTSCARHNATWSEVSFTRVRRARNENL